MNISFVCHFRTSTKKFSDFWRTYFDKIGKTAFFVSRETTLEKKTHQFQVLSGNFLVFLSEKSKSLSKLFLRVQKENLRRDCFEKFWNFSGFWVVVLQRLFSRRKVKTAFYASRWNFSLIFSSFFVFAEEISGRIFKSASCMSNGFLWAKMFLFLENKKLCLIFFSEKLLKQHSKCSNDLLQG